MIKTNCKLSLITESKSNGGANIAAERIKLNLKNKFKIQSIYCDHNNFLKKLKYFFARLLVKIFIRDDLFLNSINLFTRINLGEIKGDILLLNWIGKETISINDLNNINKPIIWISHDMWPSTATEHFLKDPFQKYYSEKNISGNFLKKVAFEKKKIFFKKKNIIIITNSKWMKNFFNNSPLTKKVKTQTIYNPIEGNIWIRKKSKYAKKKLGLDIRKKYILVGAHGGFKNYRKGLDLFIESLEYLQHLNREFEIIILGNDKNKTEIISGFKFNFRKFTSSKYDQVLYHSAANLIASPSRGESIPQFIVETLLCKNPVVSFDIGGMNEIIKHKFNGYLAKPFDKKDFANGMLHCLNNLKTKNIKIFRKKLLKMFDKKINSDCYSKTIKNFLLDHK